MKPRTVLHILVGFMVAGSLVVFASNLQVGSGRGFAEMMNAQRHTPILWVVDVCALALIAGMWWSAVTLNHFQSFVDHQAKQHHEQLDDMIDRTSDLERVNDKYADRIEWLEAEIARQFHDLADQVATLESASDTRRELYDMEMRRMAEQTQRVLLGQLEGNTHQVEATNRALQFQRDELRRLRHEILELQQELAPHISLRLRQPDLMDVYDEPLAIAAVPAAIAPAPPGFYVAASLADEKPVSLDPHKATPLRRASSREPAKDAVPLPVSNPAAGADQNGSLSTSVSEATA